VADPAQQPVGDAGGAAGAAGDLGRGVVGQADPQQAGGAAQDDLQLLGPVEVHVRDEPEPVAQRGGQHPGPGGGADEGERGDVQGDRGGSRPLADDDVDPEVLHGDVEHLLGGAGHAVDLVEEQHLALAQGGQDRGEVPGPFDGGAGGDAQRGAQLGRDDHGQGGLAESGAARHQDVVGRPAALLGAAQHQGELFADAVLPDELVEGAGAQGAFDGVL